MLPPSLGGGGNGGGGFKRPPTVPQVPLRTMPANTTSPRMEAPYRGVEALEDDTLLVEAQNRYGVDYARAMEHGRYSAEASAFRSHPVVSSNAPVTMTMPAEMRPPMNMPSEHPDTSSLVFGADGLGPGNASAVAAYTKYSMELKTWVDQQVDLHLGHFFQGFDSDLMQARKESSCALSICERLEERLAAVADSQARCISKLDNIENEVGGLKTQLTAYKISSSAMSERDNSTVALNLETLQRCCDKHEADLTRAFEMMQRLASEAPPRRELDALIALVRQVEREGKERHDGIHGHHTALSLKFEELGGHHSNILDRLGRIEGIEGLALLRQDVEAFGKQIADHITESKRDEALRAEFLQARIAEDIAASQQKLLTTMRAEMTAAFRSEAAAVTALDEQLWQIKDQQLRQQVDKVANERAKERIAVLGKKDARSQIAIGSPRGGDYRL